MLSVRDIGLCRQLGRFGRCRYQYTCGGCRAMAYFRTGDYPGEDPTCFFDPVDSSTVSEYEEETNRVFRKYLLVARAAGVYNPPRDHRDGVALPLGKGQA